MPRRIFYAPGDWNAICDTCGRRYKASELVRQWDGYMVCRTCHDPRHPQEFVRGIPDDQGVPWSRPRPPDRFVAMFTGATSRVCGAPMVDLITMG